MLSFFISFFSFCTCSSMGFFWNFGFCLIFFVMIQIFSGLFLSFYYTSSLEGAFDSVIFMFKEVNFGWVFYHSHNVGANFLFFFLYLHILSSFVFSLCGNILVWFSGVLMFVIFIVISFLGYSLPMGSMSYWAVVVVVNFFSVFPFFDLIKEVILGSSMISSFTVKSFFVFHFILPFIVVILIFFHIYFLHKNGSSNGVFEDDSNFSFFPFMFFKDFYLFVLIFLFFIFCVCFIPFSFYKSMNFVPFDVLVTPSSVSPEWYLMPFFVILKSFSSKGFGLFMVFSCFVGLIFSSFLSFFPFLNGYSFSSVFFSFVFVFLFFCFSFLLDGFFEGSNFMKFFSFIFVFSFFGINFFFESGLFSYFFSSFLVIFFVFLLGVLLNFYFFFVSTFKMLNIFSSGFIIFFVSCFYLKKKKNKSISYSKKSLLSSLKMKFSNFYKDLCILDVKLLSLWYSFWLDYSSFSPFVFVFFSEMLFNFFFFFLGKMFNNFYFCVLLKSFSFLVYVFLLITTMFFYSVLSFDYMVSSVVSSYIFHLSLFHFCHIFFGVLVSFVFYWYSGGGSIFKNASLMFWGFSESFLFIVVIVFFLLFLVFSNLEGLPLF